MSLQPKRTKSNRSAFSVCSLTIIAAFMALTSACTKTPESATADAESASPEPMNHSKMDGMKDMGGMKHMDGMSMTGNADYDFAANMRMHHQMAVDMSEAELKNGKDSQMMQMARSIITAQKKEIAVLDSWLDANAKP